MLSHAVSKIRFYGIVESLYSPSPTGAVSSCPMFDMLKCTYCCEALLSNLQTGFGVEFQLERVRKNEDYEKDDR